MRSRPPRTLLKIWIVLILFGLTHASTAMTTLRIASGLERPVCLVSPPGDYARLFVLEQYSGKIRIIRNGKLQPGEFLGIGDRINFHGDERGLLGVAFHPDYARNGYLYVNYSRAGDGATIISRFHVSPDPDRAERESELILLTIPQPYSNHNGGGIEFGPDGYLYIGTGDGGSAYDPENRAQDDNELLGKMLRIDVDHGTPYGIPPDNPFVNAPPRDEIWAKGLRNPWRFTFDRETKDLYIADVGQDKWEEIDVQPARSKGGENYGWRCMEGKHCTDLSGCECEGPLLVPPVWEYSHSDGCSVTGGCVYRGCALPELQGAYFFADYCSSKIWSFRWRGGGITDFRERTSELAPGGGFSIRSISSFGQDAYGEIYILDLQGGEVFKIVPDNLDDCNRNYVSDRCEIAAGSASDADGDSVPDECQGGGAKPGTSVPLERYALYETPLQPFATSHELVVDLIRPGLVDLVLYQVRSAQVSTLLHEVLDAGQHTVAFDAAHHPEGIYVCQLRVEGQVTRRKLLHLK